MKKYIIKVPVSTIAIYTVEAESEEEAKELILDQEVEPTQDSMQSPHYEDSDTNNWEVECITDLAERTEEEWQLNKKQ